MLYPVKDEFQQVIEHDIFITGDPKVEVHRDYFENDVGTFTNVQPHDELVIDSRLIVITKKKPLPGEVSSAANQWEEIKQVQQKAPYIDFLKLEKIEAIKDLEKIINELKAQEPTPLQLAKSLNEYVYNTFAYQKGITTVETTVDEILEIKSGVCQDFAHVLLAMLRLSSIPARYVSGYICPNRNGMRGEGATHAWVEAYIPFCGWLGLDPTNNCMVNETHVRLAVGKNFTDCSPVKGTYRGTSEHTLEVVVTVSYEDGNTIEGVNEVDPGQTIFTSDNSNSYRRHIEMQMQQ
jgi:transglutaminase-like putative cysteine protease